MRFDGEMPRGKQMSAAKSFGILVGTGIGAAIIFGLLHAHKYDYAIALIFWSIMGELVHIRMNR